MGKFKNVSVNDIKEGDILQSDVLASDGRTLLIAKGTKLNANHIFRIRNWKGGSTLIVETTEENEPKSEEELNRIKRQNKCIFKKNLCCKCWRYGQSFIRAW